MAMAEMNLMAEYAAFTVMLGLSTIIGLYYGCVSKQNTVNDYLLGNRRMAVFPIAVSLIASHVSGVTLLGVPSEIYTHGTQYLIVGGVNVLVIVITNYIFLPVFYELQLKSAYEYLEIRFNSKIRSLCSLMFAIYLIILIPIVIYTPALAFNQVTGINIHFLTSIICAVCIFYTTIGGLKAVVWTDTIQSVFTLISIVVVIVLGYKEAGGINNVIKANLDGDRIEFFNMDPNPFLRNTFWTVSIGTTFTWLNSLSIQPGTVQRFNSLPTYHKAQNALIYFVVGIALVKILTGAIGMLIYSKYKDCDPVLANLINSEKNLLPFYVMDVASKIPGLTGVFVSGIISAALSTMSAQLNTVSGTIYEDFISKYMGIETSDRTANIIMKSTTVIIGTICVALVLVVEKLKGILQISLSLISVTGGSMLSAFTLGICFPCANAKGAMCGMLASVITMTWIISGAQVAIYNDKLMFDEKPVSITGCPANTTFRNPVDYSGLDRMNKDVYVDPSVWKIYTISYMHYSTIGTLIGIAVGLIVSLLFPIDQKIDPKLLAPFIRKFKYPNYKDNRELTEIKPDKYEAVPQTSRL